jgi:hypothetical protein
MKTPFDFDEPLCRYAISLKKALMIGAALFVGYVVYKVVDEPAGIEARIERVMEQNPEKIEGIVTLGGAAFLYNAYCEERDELVQLVRMLERRQPDKLESAIKRYEKTIGAVGKPRFCDGVRRSTSNFSFLQESKEDRDLLQQQQQLSTTWNDVKSSWKSQWSKLMNGDLPNIR